MATTLTTPNGRPNAGNIVLSQQLISLQRMLVKLTESLDTTHSVFVENQTEMPGSIRVETDGFQKVISQLRSDTGSIKSAIDSMRDSIAGISFPTPPSSMEVRLTPQDIVALRTEFPEIKIPSIPSFMEVSDRDVQVKLDELVQAIKAIKIPRQPKSQTIENLINIPQELFDLLANLPNLQLLSGDPETPLAVRLSDGEKFYNSIVESVDRMTQAVALPIAAFKDAAGGSSQVLVDGNNRGKVTGDNYTTKISYVAAGNGAGEIEYVGKALPGSAEGDSLWQIQKLTYDANDKLTDVQWEDGDDTFDNDWTNRASGSYS